MLTFDEFVAGVRNTLIETGDPKHDALHMACGLAEEAGEVLGKFKRMLRGDAEAEFGSPEWLAAVRKEAGDTQWYLAALCIVLGGNVEFECMAREVLAKTADRKARGVLKGSGDTR